MNYGYFNGRTWHVAIAAIERTLASRGAEIKLAEERTQQIRALAEERSQQIRTLTNRVAELERTLSQLQSSFSWRATAPLRSARRLLSRWCSFLLRPGFAGDAYEWHAYKIIRRSGLFDERGYLANNPDVAQHKVDALLHYLRTGAREGRDPSPLFSSSAYLDNNPDVAAAGFNPLLHFVQYGTREGRSAAPPGTENQGVADVARTFRNDVRPVVLRPVVLHLLHLGCGGTEKHVRELAETYGNKAKSLLLKVGVDSTFVLTSLDAQDHLKLSSRYEDLPELCDLVKSFGANRIHVHHVLGFENRIDAFLRRMGLPYDLTIHDYMLVCPRVYMYRRNIGYCGEPNEAGCLNCLREAPAPLSVDIFWWRWMGRQLIEGAQRVICPTWDVAERIGRYAPQANLITVLHEDSSQFSRRNIQLPELTVEMPIRIVVLGTVAEHKGAYFLLECASIWKQQRLQVELTVIGKLEIDGQDTLRVNDIHRITGTYNQTDLPQLIRNIDPHLIFYPQKCLETYSYTLSEGLISGRPILAPNLGAFTERLAAQDWCWLYNQQMSAENLAILLKRIRAEHLEPKLAPPVVASVSNEINRDRAEFYQNEYLGSLERFQPSAVAVT